MIAERPSPPGAAEGPRSPWAEGSVPLRRVGSEEAERALRLEVVRSRGRRARRVRMMGAATLGLALLGGIALIVSNLVGDEALVAGEQAEVRREAPAAGPPQRVRVAPARALPGAPQGVARRSEVRRDRRQPTERVALMSAPDATSTSVEAQAPEVAPPPAEATAPPVEEASEKEFGFER